MLTLCVIIYLTLYYIRPTEWVVGLVGTPLLMIVGIISLLILGVGALSNKYRFLFSGKEEKMMVGLIAAIMLSHISHFYFGGAINSFSKFFPSFVVLLLVICFVDNRSKVNFFVILLIGLTLFLAYEGLLQYKTGFAHGGLEPIFQKGLNDEVEATLIPRIRWYGVFNDPNDFGLALIIVVPFLLNMLLEKRLLPPFVTLPPIALAVYYTNSRGTVLAGLVAITSYFVIRYRSAKGALWGAGVSVALFMFGPSRISTISADEESAYGRIEAWYEAYQMFKSYPLFGVGQGMFTDYHYRTAHNSFVLVMAELGFIGLFFFTALFYFSYYWLWRNVLKNKQQSYSPTDIGLISASYASLTGMLSAMFFLSRAYILLPYMLLALVVAITRIVDSERHRSLSYAPAHHWRYIFICTILQIIGINIVVKLTL